MFARSSLQALTEAPLRFLRSAWPWRSLLYLLASAIPGSLVVGFALLGQETVGVLGFGVIGFAVLIVVSPLITRFEGYRMRLVDSAELAKPVRGNPLQLLRGSQIWREFAHALVALLALWWIDLGIVALSLGIPGVLLTAPWQPGGTGPIPSAFLAMAGLLLIPVAAYPITAWAGARAAMGRAILSHDDIEEVRRSRSRLVDSFEEERRRIERDLHDGPQQRLIALAMRLGVARLGLDERSQAYREVTWAHDEAKSVLSEIREVIRGIHPQVLSGRGLAAAIRDVAGRSSVPVDLTLGLPERLPSTVEVNAYYMVAEALANATKHSRADIVWVKGAMVGDNLLLHVGDNGVGGAHPKDDASGLVGMADRAAAVDGTVSLSSPAGGPTVVKIEIPVHTEHT